jgi:PHD/YefM family antitoxin component YafN of YafNO toxin-antitoxin module
MDTPEGAVSITQFLKSRAGTLLRLNAEGSPIALTRKGRSVAVLVDLDTFAWLIRRRDAREND